MLSWKLNISNSLRKLTSWHSEGTSAVKTTATVAGSQSSRHATHIPPLLYLTRKEVIKKYEILRYALDGANVIAQK